MSDFSPDGEHRDYPHLYQDEQQVGDYLTWPLSALQRLDEQYTYFIQDPSSFPPHVERAIRIHRHIGFELMSRTLEGLRDGAS